MLSSSCWFPLLQGVSAPPAVSQLTSAGGWPVPAVQVRGALVSACSTASILPSRALAQVCGGPQQSVQGTWSFSVHRVFVAGGACWLPL